ncbi:hypothetical protein [Patulibacter minatonensis]|uniref:hypothetical protein n=1 Tax=Patulibacter minatonensis TaxID=298163 RepID=UPI0004B73811|nr:hypothetical protein [Patulibacter minatonensis]
MSGTEPVEIPVPAAVADLRLLSRVGYDDAFAVDTASDHGPEWWMRTFIEGAPRWFQLPWLGMGKAVLGVRIGPLAGSPDHVLGWKVLDAGPTRSRSGSTPPADSPRA